MKTLKCVFVLLAFVAVTFLGCSDQSQSPIAPNANDNSVTSLMKPGSGAWIIRHEETGWFYAYYDADSGLLLTLGLQDNSMGCDGITDVYNIKDLYLPNADPELRRILAHHKADVTAMVWKVTPCPCSDLCDFLTANEPTAIGVVNFRYNDNDVLAWMQDNKNSNAFSTKANGTLVGLDGKLYNLNFLEMLVWDGVDKNRSYKFKIQLIPTGK